MKKILTVVGARPQFIKAAAVSRALRKTPGLSEILVHTGQHYDANMSDVFFKELEIPKPDHHLGIGSGPHGAMTGQMLGAIEATLLSERPDVVLVYGDTNSTLAGALAAAKLGIPIAHVEAGLRSFNRAMPEEINRVLTDHVSALHFCPTDTAVKNLAREGITGAGVQKVGDVMYDASLYYAAKSHGAAAPQGLKPSGYALATIHRAENTDDPARLRIILEGLGIAARSLPVILPLHPRTRAALKSHGIEPAPGIRVIDPVGYLQMIELERHARVIVTDSGGVQKEAFFFHVPCITLRHETEWVELVELGWNRLVPPTSAEEISGAILGARSPSRQDAAPYGAGDAAEKIARALLESKGIS